MLIIGEKQKKRLWFVGE